MKFFLNLVILIIILSSHPILPQGRSLAESALPFLNITPSPLSAGLGWTGVSIPNNDAYGFNLNPAMLGYFSQTNNLVIQSNPGNVDWMNYGFLNISGYAVNAGYNFKNELNGLSVSLGAGFLKNKFAFQSSSAENDNFDLYNSYGAGAAINYYVILALGITYKDIHSEIANLGADNKIRKLTGDAGALDYGLLFTVPISDLIGYKFILSGNKHFTPLFNYSIGYSRLNISDGIYYTDPAQKDPLPLTARLGHTINFGCIYETDDININLLDYDFILEADDILLKREFNDRTFETTYQGMLGDIDFGKHLIQLKSDDNVLVHKAHSVSLLETLTILRGSFDGRYYDRTVKSDGVIFRSTGFFKWLSSYSESRILKFLANHIEIKYISSNLFVDEAIETNFSGLSVSLKNFSFN